MLLVFPLAILFSWIWGCEQKPTAPIVNNNNDISTIDNYFPLVTGKTSVYVTTHSGVDPNIVTREKFVFGDAVEGSDECLYSWIRTNLAYSSISDTSYFYRNENALYFYENAGSEPEKILEEPIEVGKSWERFTNPGADSNNLFLYLLENANSKYYENHPVIEENKDSLPEIYGFAAGRVFPTVGSGTMTIVAIEDVELENGLRFENCIKINIQGGTYANYYWYAKDQGLIKYVIGVDESLATSSTPDGIIVGEIGSAGKVFF